MLALLLIFLAVCYADNEENNNNEEVVNEQDDQNCNGNIDGENLDCLGCNWSGTMNIDGSEVGRTFTHARRVNVEIPVTLSDYTVFGRAEFYVGITAEFPKDLTSSRTVKFNYNATWIVDRTTAFLLSMYADIFCRYLAYLPPVDGGPDPDSQKVFEALQEISKNGGGFVNDNTFAINVKNTETDEKIIPFYLRAEANRRFEIDVNINDCVVSFCNNSCKYEATEYRKAQEVCKEQNLLSPKQNADSGLFRIISSIAQNSAQYQDVLLYIDGLSQENFCDSYAGMFNSGMITSYSTDCKSFLFSEMSQRQTMNFTAGRFQSSSASSVVAGLALVFISLLFTLI